VPDHCPHCGRPVDFDGPGADEWAAWICACPLPWAIYDFADPDTGELGPASIITDRNRPSCVTYTPAARLPSPSSLLPSPILPCHA
jgi:hypothetical protein